MNKVKTFFREEIGVFEKSDDIRKKCNRFFSAVYLRSTLF